MTKTITFNELRRIKDSLPDGSTQRIADELGLKVETVSRWTELWFPYRARSGRRVGCFR